MKIYHFLDYRFNHKLITPMSYIYITSLNFIHTRDMCGRVQTKLTEPLWNNITETTTWTYIIVAYLTKFLQLGSSLCIKLFSMNRTIYIGSPTNPRGWAWWAQVVHLHWITLYMFNVYAKFERKRDIGLK